MSKNNLFKTASRNSASKLHKQMGELLSTSPLLANLRYYQEYPVNRVSPYYDSGRERFDWVILDWKVAIEMHGRQHYEPVRFGGITQEEAELALKLRELKDIEKRTAAESVGWQYVVFKYDEEVTVTALLNKIHTYEYTVQMETEPREPCRKTKPKQTDEQKQRAREYRKQQYQRAKAWKKSRS